MAVYSVTNTDDSGPGSLRQAVLDANANAGADTIVFSSSVAGQTITLTSGQLDLSDDVTINGDTNGDRMADITISGNDASRIFYTNTPNADVVLRSLKLTDGNTTDRGGAIYINDGLATLTVIDSTISGNHANDRGGGIYTRGVSVLTDTTISGNSSSLYGGGIYVNGTVTIINTTLSDNTGLIGGGIFVDASQQLFAESSTITNNSATNRGGGIAISGNNPVSVENSVVSGNTAPSGGDVDEFFNPNNFRATNSFFGQAVAIDVDGGGNINGGGDALLGALADNGGPVMTRRPLANSPLVNAGSAALLPADAHDIDSDSDTAEALPLDATGRARSSGTGLDIGAAEFINTAPVITSAAAFSVPENGTVAATVTGSDPDLGDSLNYSIAGGADAARFTINTTTGALAFLTAPDFENPTDSNGDNIYDVVVRATDLEGLFGQKTVAVTVTDVAEPRVHDFSAGAVTVTDTLARLNGDTFKDFAAGDRIVISNVDFARKQIAFDTATGVMTIDANHDGKADATFNFQGERPAGDFIVVSAASGTRITFHRFLPELHEAVALAPQHHNGITNPDFLTGDGTRDFRVSLDPAAGADDTNALGVYEVTPDGRIVDVRILFLDVKADPDATTTVTDVEAGNRLGFFIVKTDADLVRLLPSAAISFVDIGGNAATASSNELFMLVNGGGGTKAMHSFSHKFNGFGIDHAVSGVVPGGEAMEVAFEDTNLADGDLDFQDVVFTVHWVV